MSTGVPAASASASSLDVAHAPAPAAGSAAFTPCQGLAYGALGLPLAFVALPLYVILPNHYAREFGMPLATLGAILLAARLFDAFIDPTLGSISDKLYTRSISAVLGFGALAAVLLFVGFALLFFPPVQRGEALAWWAGAMLVFTYAAYSALAIGHQSWGAMLGGDEAHRSRVVAWREGLGLVGVLLASVTPVLLGLPATVGLFALCLLLGWLAWTQAPQPERALHIAQSNDTVRAEPALAPSPIHVGAPAPKRSIWHPFAQPDFRRLLAVFMLNGIASAIPATLVLFFIQDRLQAPPALEAAFLGTYFLCAALCIPLWLQGVKRYGLARSWLAGMLLAIAVFAWASQLGAGDVVAFLAVCALSGVALGSDLALPPALLAGVIQRAGDRGQAEGAYFGWWNFATKLNLALAAGLALPALAAFGYSPGVRDAQATGALVIAYCVLPCALKLLAAASLYFFNIKGKP